MKLSIYIGEKLTLLQAKQIARDLETGCLCLFPEIYRSPREIVDFVLGWIAAINQENVHGGLFTHSPFVLAAINTCLQAYTSSKTDPEKTTKLFEPKYWLNFDNVQAWDIKTDGTAESILNLETRLLDENSIDRVQEEQFDLWNELSDIEILSEASCLKHCLLMTDD